MVVLSVVVNLLAKVFRLLTAVPHPSCRLLRGCRQASCLVSLWSIRLLRELARLP